MWNHNKTLFDPKPSEILSFYWYGSNGSESEVGQSYGGHVENEFKMRRYKNVPKGVLDVTLSSQCAI